MCVRVHCTESLQDLLLVSGKSAGAGHCLWANEFEIGVIAKALRLGCLILGQSYSALDFSFKDCHVPVPSERNYVQK